VISRARRPRAHIGQHSQIADQRQSDDYTKEEPISGCAINKLEQTFDAIATGISVAHVHRIRDLADQRAGC
jgi:hypothetical protein